MLGVLEWIWRILIWGPIIGSLIGVVIAVIRSKYARQRLLQLVIVVFAVTLLTFSLLRLLPGRPEIAIAGIGANEQQLQEVRKEWGLDKPIPVQYVKWLQKLFTGDLGRSSSFNVPVTDLVQQRLPVSLMLMVYAMFISLAIAIPLGVLTAYRANRSTDRSGEHASRSACCPCRRTSSACCSCTCSPSSCEWFPAQSKYYSFFDSPSEHFQNMLLPASPSPSAEIAIFQRLLRTDMISTLQEDFITMARAKGMPTTTDPVPPRLATLEVLAHHRGRPEHRAPHRRRLIVEMIFGLNGMGRSPSRPCSGGTSWSCRAAS